MEKLSAPQFEHKREPWRMQMSKSNRKFERGKNCCGQCRNGLHKQCRPFLETWSICTCSCPRGTEFREVVEARLTLAKRRGEPRPTVEEIYKDFVRR